MAASFRTVVEVSKGPFTVALDNKIMLVGSCFTEHIGRQLANNGFNILSNPSGILYNPVSIGRVLHTAIQPIVSKEAIHLFQHDGLWHHWDYHGSFSNPDSDLAAAGIYRSQWTLADFMTDCDRIFLTLGTADVFVGKATNQVVANCHKVPATDFIQRRLSVEEVVAAIAEPLQQLKMQRPALQVVLTVSPVRHVRTGAIENQRSKAVLLLACAELERVLPFTHYFPAYELVLDDLRDYRFYASDMVHPSEMAVEYIWNALEAAYCPPSTQELMRQVRKMTTASLHQPFNPQTAQHQQFVRQQLLALENVENEHPYLDLKVVRKRFQEQLMDR